jgi:Methyladenine glycosylase
MRSATIPKKRCAWASVDDRLLLQYHDLEWAVPVHSDSKHFEVLVLSGAQAGLNWSLVLKRRTRHTNPRDRPAAWRTSRSRARRRVRLTLHPHTRAIIASIRRAVRRCLSGESLPRSTLSSLSP